MMDADGWDGCADPWVMRAIACDRTPVRKWRLAMAAAVLDAHRHHLLPAVADACSLAARMADGFVTNEQLETPRAAIRKNWGATELTWLLADYPTTRAAADGFGWVCVGLDRIEPNQTARAGWLREVVGNPFRWVRWEDEWVTRTVHALAAPAYAAGRFDTLPVLADALDDAGCDNDELLAHLRGPGPHARGCWALDVVLGKV